MRRATQKRPPSVLSEPLGLWAASTSRRAASSINRTGPRQERHRHDPRHARRPWFVVVIIRARRGAAAGTAPAAIVLSTPDPILTVGALVAQSLYGESCPIVVCDIAELATGNRVRVRASDGGDAGVEVI
jgi:hypothetical protein